MENNSIPIQDLIEILSSEESSVNNVEELAKLVDLSLHNREMISLKKQFDQWDAPKNRISRT